MIFKFVDFQIPTSHQLYVKHASKQALLHLNAYRSVIIVCDSLGVENSRHSGSTTPYWLKRGIEWSLPTYPNYRLKFQSFYRSGLDRSFHEISSSPRDVLIVTYGKGVEVGLDTC